MHINIHITIKWYRSLKFLKFYEFWINSYVKFAFRRFYEPWNTQKSKFKVLPILESVFTCLGEPGMPTEPIIYHQHGLGTLIWPSLLEVSQLCQWCEVAYW